MTVGLPTLVESAMGEIDTPHKVFGHLTEFKKDSGFLTFVLMREEKYESFPKEDRERIESCGNIKVNSVEIPSPNNPAVYLKAKLISFAK